MSEAVVIGIYRQKDRSLAGCGFLVDACTLVTCAHVINTALGKTNKKETTKPVESEKFEVSHLNSKNGYNGTATLHFWALKDTYTVCDDIAVLKLDTPFTDDLLQDCWLLGKWDNTRFRAYGKTPNGEGWVSGQIMGEVSGGLIQIDSESVKQLSAGYSGTPIFASNDLPRHQLIGFAVAMDAKDSEVAKMIPVSRIEEIWDINWGEFRIQKKQNIQRNYVEPKHLSFDDDSSTQKNIPVNRFYETLKFVKDFDDNHNLRLFDHTEPSISLCLLMCDTIEQNNHTDYIGQELSTISLQVKKVIELNLIPDDIKRKLIIYFRQYVEIALLISVYRELEGDNRHESTKDTWLASLKDIDQYEYTKDLLDVNEETIKWRQLKKRHEQMCSLLNKYILTLKNLPENYQKVIQQFNSSFENNSNDVLAELKQIVQARKDIMLSEFAKVKNKVLHADEIDELIDSICRSMIPDAQIITAQREKIREKADAVLALRPQTDKSKITLSPH